MNKLKGLCQKICILKEGHSGQHDCKGIHYFLKNCYYKDKSRGCINYSKCILEYRHDGKFLCSLENLHLCNKNCSKKNCKNICILINEHKENNHDCKEFHKCTKPCYLKEITLEGECNLECSLDIDHDGHFLCSKKKEAHLCRNKCINCHQNCTLNAGHKESCFWGKCICGKECQYKDKSRNCKKKCMLKFNHEGKHICEEIEHLCSHECTYKEKQP